MAFLLVFGLLGWVLAGRMLAPLSRITDATRLAATGSLSHRIELEGRKDEFRELADSFDAMLVRLEAHVGEQQRFAANASHELRTRWRSRRHFSTWPARSRTAATASCRPPPRRQHPSDRPHRSIAVSPRRPTVLRPRRRRPVPHSGGPPRRFSPSRKTKTAAVGERLPYLLQKMKAPRVLERLEQTAARAREEQWPYEQFLEALLEAEVFARDASGARQRVRHAAFPAHKTLEDFDFTAQPGAEKPLILHLAQLAWIAEHSNVCFFGPPGTGKTHLSIALAIKACQAGHRVAFATAQQWVDRLEQAQHRNALDDELRRIERYALIVVDEIGSSPWNARPPTCCSPWSRAATNAARSSSPATAASRRGARSSATRWSPPPSSTASSTTPTWSRSRARATASARGAQAQRQRFRLRAYGPPPEPLHQAQWCTFRFLIPVHFSVPVDKEEPGATRRHRRDSWAPAQQGTVLRDLRFLLQPPIRMWRDCSHGRGHAGYGARTCRLAAPAAHDASRFVLRCSLAVFRCEIPRRMSGAGASRHPWNRR